MKVCSVRSIYIGQFARSYEFMEKVLSLSKTFHHIEVSKDEVAGVPSNELKDAACCISDALFIREKYASLIGHKLNQTTAKFIETKKGKYMDGKDLKKEVTRQNQTCCTSSPEDSTMKFQIVNGVFRVYENNRCLERNQPRDLPYPDLDVFVSDLNYMMTIAANASLNAFCMDRLSYLLSKFQLHTLLNKKKEQAAQKNVPHRDFYNCRKVDTHVHVSSCMNQKQLLRFMKKTLKRNSPEIVYSKNGKEFTLQEVFGSLNLSSYDLSIDCLDMHANKNTFHRFDKFNATYNPIGQSMLREIFLKSANRIEGRFFADIIKEVMEGLKDGKYQQAEYRISIYGRSEDEWTKLAKWVFINNVYCENVRWLIQIPRLFDVYRSKGLLNNFAELLSNIFKPLFEATLFPNEHPEIHSFLKQVSGFDSVDDESKPEHHTFSLSSPLPQDWTSAENTPYTYYIYYMYANIVTLNQLRRERGMNAFDFRPHCGEAGSTHHLIAAYLLANNISHGLVLRKVAVIQYLFYLHQIGIAMSPLCNNKLFLRYDRNPFPDYFAMGLLVSLSTDAPLQFHYTKEPLMEEYSVAAQMWKLSSCDMCELARNSVIMSGFSDQIKQRWLGSKYWMDGPEGNEITKTNVPDIRLAYRHETLQAELAMLLGPT